MKNKIDSLESAIDRYVYLKTAPHVFARVNSFAENLIILKNKADLLAKKVGKQKARKLIKRFEAEAISRPDVINSVYIINKIELEIKA